MVIIQSQHSGVIGAANLGLEACRGEIIVRMDADDRMRPDRLKQQVKTLETQSNLSLLACQVHLFPEQTIQAGYQE
jgi:cellulose synthase/poly-beta-1,6-N-acetylglucosamine synthase-like glycosyltransferase